MQNTAMTKLYEEIRKYWRFDDFTTDFFGEFGLIVMGYKGDRFHINQNGDVEFVYVDFGTGEEIHQTIGKNCHSAEEIHAALRTYDYLMFRKNVFGYMNMICSQPWHDESGLISRFVMPLRMMGFDVTILAKSMANKSWNVKIDNWVFAVFPDPDGGKLKYKFIEEQE